MMKNTFPLLMLLLGTAGWTNAEFVPTGVAPGSLYRLIFLNTKHHRNQHQPRPVQFIRNQ